MIKSRHRRDYKAGKIDDIPLKILQELEEKEPIKKEIKKEAPKPKKKESKK